LLVLRLLAGQVPSWLGCRYGVASLYGCSQAVNIDSLPQLSYHSSPPKDQDSTEGPKKATRGGVNGSLSKFLDGTCPTS
jgi:hypothetical protein